MINKFILLKFLDFVHRAIFSFLHFTGYHTVICLLFLSSYHQTFVIILQNYFLWKKKRNKKKENENRFETINLKIKIIKGVRINLLNSSIQYILFCPGTFKFSYFLLPHYSTFASTPSLDPFPYIYWKTKEFLFGIRPIFTEKVLLIKETFTKHKPYHLWQDQCGSFWQE